MSRFLTVAALLLVSACGQTSDTNSSAATNAAAAAAADAVPTTPELAGEWQLTKVDGRPLDGGPANITFEGGKARLLTGCTRRAWTYTQKRNIVSFTANPGGSSNCERAPTIKEETAFQAFTRAKMVIFAKEGREASLSGDGGNVTLLRR